MAKVGYYRVVKSLDTDSTRIYWLSDEGLEYPDCRVVEVVEYGSPIPTTVSEDDRLFVVHSLQRQNHPRHCLYIEVFLELDFVGG